MVLVAGVVSRTHLIYAASWLRAQGRGGRTIEEVVVRPPRPFLGRLRVTEEECCEVLSDAVPGRVRIGDGSTGAFGTLLCIGAPALRQIMPMARRSRRLPSVVVVDEGIGSYGDRATRAAAYRRNGNSWTRAHIRAGVVSAGRRLLTREEWTSYIRSDDRWRVNEAVADEFRHRVAGAEPEPGVAVWLSQPWPALGVLPEHSYRSHVAQLHEACERAGLELVIRPHPADSPDRYTGFRVSDSDLPAELDRAVIGADVVLGASSTALLNLAAFYESRCVRVQPDDLATLEGQLGWAQASLLDAFLAPARTPGELVL